MADQATTATPNFEQALRLNFRFIIPGTGGVVTTEDLYQFTKEKLDKAYVAYKKLLKDSGEESLLTTKKADPDHYQAKADILAYIIRQKVEVEQKRAKQADIRARKQHLLSIAHDIQNEADRKKTVDEIKAELAVLDQELE